MSNSSPAPSPSAGPLSGIKVLDFSSYIAGSFAAMLLGDLGADVIKIEAPIGDLARTWGPFLNGEAAMFQGWNRNKRGLALDLGKPTARTLIDQLVAQADVLVENFRPGISEKLGIDYPRTTQLNPRLIYCSSTAFGNRGPERFRPGYDPVFQAIGGVADINGIYTDRPTLTAVSVSDYQAAMLLVTGCLAALFHRERTGTGQLVETSLLQGVMSIQSHFFVEALECEPREKFGIFPYHLFETAEGPLFIGAPTDKFWQLTCEALEIPEWINDPRSHSNVERVKHQPLLTEVLTHALSQRTAEEWEQILAKHGIPCGCVRPHREFFHATQTTAMEMNPVISHSTIGPLRVAGVPVHLEKSPGSIRRAAPRLGEHSREILQELGLSQTAIDELIAQQIILSAG